MAAEGNGAASDEGLLGVPSDVVIDPVRDLEERRALTANFKALETSFIMARYQFARQAGITFGGARDTYEILGYDRLISNKQYRERYMRGGVAGRVVDAFPNACWRGEMEIVEDEDPKSDTAFEQAWNALDTRLQVRAKLRRVDKLAGLSTYAVLLIGAQDTLDQELPKGSSQEQILYLTPFSGGGGAGGGGTTRTQAFDADASIVEYETDSSNPRFGEARFYQLRRLNVAMPMDASRVHWSRIIHVAEDLLDDEIFGTPRLERVWNLLDDLDKVTGGGAEAFWLRANQGLHLDIDKDMSLPDVKDTIANLKDQSEAYKHQLTRWLRTRGVKTEVLGSDVANFSGPADVLLTQISGATAIPKRILTGSEMGQLASSQDRDNWKDQVNGRQTSHVGPYIVRQLVDRLVKYGYLPTPAKGPLAYEVRWPHIQTMTEQEKAEGAAKWAAVNQTYGGTVFTADEIRDKWYSMEPTDPKGEDTQPWRATLALKMAEANKTQGAIIFTDDEIRKTCYGWKPLTPEQKVPLTAPERVSANAPTPEIDAQGNPIPAAPQKGAPGAFPRAVPRVAEAEDAELLRILQDAIEAGNTDVVERIVGLQHSFGSTQVELPTVVSNVLLMFGQSIPDSEIDEAAGGRETDPHVTVRYGLLDPNAEALSELLAGHGPVSFTLGRVGVFVAEDHDVVLVNVNGPELADLNGAISQGVPAAKSDFATYQPHVTVAYVKSGEGAKYTGLDILDGVVVTVDKIIMTDVDGNKTPVSLL